MKSPEITVDDIVNATASIAGLAPKATADFTDEDWAALIFGMPVEALFRPINYRWQGEEGYAAFLAKLDKRREK